MTVITLRIDEQVMKWKYNNSVNDAWSRACNITS